VINKPNILRYLRSKYSDDITIISSLTFYSLYREEHIGVTIIDKSGYYLNYAVKVKDVENYLSTYRDLIINQILEC